MIASVVAGGAAGAAVMVKLAGRKVRDTMSLRKRGADEASAAPPDATASDVEAADDDTVDVEAVDADVSAEVPRAHG